MKLRTIPEAARALGMDTQAFRRRVAAGKIPSYDLGGRLLVDVDEAARILETERGSIGIREASALTGLTEGMIRRAVRDGLLPCIRVGNGIRFVPAALLEALEKLRRE